MRTAVQHGSETARFDRASCRSLMTQSNRRVWWSSSLSTPATSTREARTPSSSPRRPVDTSAFRWLAKSLTLQSLPGHPLASRRNRRDRLRRHHLATEDHRLGGPFTVRGGVPPRAGLAIGGSVGRWSGCRGSRGRPTNAGPPAPLGRRPGGLAAQSRFGWPHRTAARNPDDSGPPLAETFRTHSNSRFVPPSI